MTFVRNGFDIEVVFIFPSREMRNTYMLTTIPLTGTYIKYLRHGVSSP
jgi:hypothetical protein